MNRKFELGFKDKRPAPHGYGSDFKHTEPQRRVPCIVGNMLAPASADDIPPVTASAYESVSRAFDLLAQLVGDRDHNLFLGNADRDGRCTREAEAISRAKDGVLAILRLESREQRHLFLDLLTALYTMSEDFRRQCAEAGDAAPDVCRGPVADVVFAYRRFKETAT